MTNEDLADLIKKGIDVGNNMLQLWKQTEPFICSIARRYQGYAELEDLIQEGYLALYDAIDGYDQERSSSFLNYAGFHIRLKMRRYIFGNCKIHIPEGLQENIRKYEKAVQTLEMKNGRSPDKNELVEYMEISEEKLLKIMNVRDKYRVGSLDVVAVEDGEDTICDLISSGEDIAERIIENELNKQLKNTLWSMVGALEAEQAKVICIKYQNNLTVPQVAEILGVTKEEVICTEKKGIRTLRRPKTMSRLRPFLPEYEESIAYRNCGVGVFNRTWTSSTENAAICLC